MSKQEALKELSKGNRITHRYFTDEEYIYQDGSYYYDENGYASTPDYFWHYRRNASFEDGWSIHHSNTKK